jgi:hypothetical protein
MYYYYYHHQVVSHLRVCHDEGHLVQQQIIVALDLTVPLLVHLLLLQILCKMHVLWWRLVVDGGLHLNVCERGQEKRRKKK